MQDVQCDNCGSWNTEHYAGDNYLCLDCDDITSAPDEGHETDQ